MHVVVVGSGLGGLLAALRLAASNRVDAVTVVTKSGIGVANTAWAQGGVAGVLGPGDGGPGPGWAGRPGTDIHDSIDAHVADTLAAGAGLSVPEAVRVLCGEAPDALRSLIELGVRFDRMPDGSLARGLEAAHSAARILHAGGDATGAEIERALVDAVAGQPRIRVREYVAVAELLVVDGAVAGVVLASGERIAANAVLIASGGAGQLFAHTTNPAVATGDGVAAAWRAGPELADVEFYQFHPTALAAGSSGTGSGTSSGAFLISEAVRGEGAVLRNAHGERFMLSVDRRGELAPRDIVARGIATEMAAQNGVPVVLDATALGADRLAERFPTIDRAVRAAGYDWAHEPIPVTPAAHYWMGGIATDLAGRATLPGLWAVGEAASTGVHGANRLASNSLLEAAVFARRAASDIVDTATGRAADARVARAVAAQRPPAVAAAVADAWSGSAQAIGGDDSARAKRSFRRIELQRLMWEHAGVQRSGDGLREAAATLERWAEASIDEVDLVDGADAVVALEDRALLDLARVVVEAALDREESRGAHYRSDFPASREEYAARRMRVREAVPGARLREGVSAC